MRGSPLTIISRSFQSTWPASICQRLDRALVVGPVALVDKGHGAITLEVGNGRNRSIDRKLLVVSTQTVTVGIGIREESGLKDRIGGGLDVRNEMGRRKCGLNCRDVAESEIEHLQIHGCSPARSRQSSFAGSR
jgi:hypothetical protein